MLFPIALISLFTICLVEALDFSTMLSFYSEPNYAGRRFTRVSIHNTGCINVATSFQRRSMSINYARNHTGKNQIKMYSTLDCKGFYLENYVPIPDLDKLHFGKRLVSYRIKHFDE